MNIEKIAEEIKLELHDKHMMYIDGEDQVTHRWCKQIIWRVLNKHLKNIIILLTRSEGDVYANDVLQRRLEDDEWQNIVKEIHEAQDYIDGAYVHMSDMICEMDKTCEDCGGQGSFDREPFPNYDICETCDGTGEID